MKTTWKIVFAFFLLLPLAGCEEECNSPSGSNPASDPAAPEPIKICYKDRLTGEPIPINQDTIMVKGTAQNGELVGAWMETRYLTVDNGVPRFPALFIYDQSYRRVAIRNYYIEFPSVTDTLRIETDNFNAGDCDELKTYRFYYNDRLVFTSEDPTEPFFVEK